MRRLKPTLAILFLIFLAASPRAAAQTTAVPVSITALDQSGARIQGVQIELTPSPDVSPENMITDERGGLSLNLKPGTYHLTATRPGFLTFTTQFEVKASGEPQNLMIRIKSDPNARVIESVGPRVQRLRVSAAPYHDDVSYRPADLKTMPRTTVTIHNAHTNAEETYSGVRVADLLRPLGVPLGNDLRGVAVALYIVAAGSDNYKAVVALAEIDPEFHPGEVIVADTFGGEPLGSAAPFRLIVSEDKRPARAVRNLVSIELKSAK